MKPAWFSHDPEAAVPFMFHATPEEARERANSAFADERGRASEGWSNDVEDICWGRVLGRVVETGRLNVPPGVTVDEDGRGSDGNDYSSIPSGCDACIDYGMEEQA